jgi:hypothetical protein
MNASHNVDCSKLLTAINVPSSSDTCCCGNTHSLLFKLTPTGVMQGGNNDDTELGTLSGAGCVRNVGCAPNTKGAGASCCIVLGGISCIPEGGT